MTMTQPSRSGQWMVSETSDSNRCSLAATQRMARVGMLTAEPVNPYRPGKEGKPVLEPGLLQPPTFTSDANVFGEYLQTYAEVIKSTAEYVYRRAGKDRRRDRRLARREDRNAVRKWLADVLRVAKNMASVGKSASACGTFDGMPDKLFRQVQCYFIFRIGCHQPSSHCSLSYLMDVIREGANPHFLFVGKSAISRIHALHMVREAQREQS